MKYDVYFLSGGTSYNTFVIGPGTATTFTIPASRPYAAWTVRVTSTDAVLGESELSAADGYANQAESCSEARSASGGHLLMGLAMVP